MAQKVSTYMSNFLNRVFTNVYLILVLQLVSLYSTSLSADSNEKLILPVDLTKLNWYAKQGFAATDASQDQTIDQTEYKKINNFPIILNSIYKIPISNDSVKEFTLQCNFQLNLERIDKGKELAFLFSGIGESWEVYLNGEKIKDEFGLENNQIVKYKTTRNSIITIPYDLLREKNNLTIHIAGSAPSSFLAPNSLSGLRFKDGYILDYEKRLQESIQQTTLLLFNAVYIFFGLYHLFFFIRWTEKKYNLYFAIFSISISIYFLSFSNIAFTKFEDTRSLLFFAYVSQPIAVMSFILFLYDYFYPSRKLSLFIKYAILSNLIIVLAFCIFKINFFHTFLFSWYILIIPQIGYIFYFIINATRKGLKDSVLMASSILVILLVVIWEIIDTIVFQTGIRFLQFAYFGFILSMVIILANRFIEINWETRRLNIELTHERDSFSKFVPTQFLDMLGKSSAKDISLGECKLQEMTILFADIRDFTSLSESMSPEENFRFINSYLKKMSPVIEKNNGFIDKFIGDAIMAIFHLPDEGLKASIEMIEELQKLNDGRNRAGYRPLRIGIGLNTGMLMMGTIGHEDRLSTTVIGDTVNLSARLESLTKEYFTPILVSEFTVSKLQEDNKEYLREIDSVVVKGKTNSVKIFECFKIDSDDLIEKKIHSRKEFTEAVSFLESEDYETALEKFLKLKDILIGDVILSFHIIRCQEMIDSMKKRVKVAS
jgi:adenylate cyclase